MMQNRQIQMAAQTSETVGQMWDSLGGLSDADLARFSAQAIPTVQSAQAFAIREEFAFLSLVEGVSIQPSIPEVAALVRPSVTPAQVYARPSITARVAIASGKNFAQAMAEARTRATVLAHTDVSLSYRQAAVSHAESPRSRIVGWRRLPDGNACRFCLLLGTKRYRVKELMPIHNRCNCSVMPIIGSRDPGNVIDSDLLKKLKTEGPQAKVVKHGELGPIIERAS